MNSSCRSILARILPALLPILLHTLAPPVPAETAVRSVSVSRFVQHPALDTLMQGFMDYFEEKDVPIKYSIHNAGGDPDANVKIAERIAGENPDLVLAISTPSSQACLKTVRSSIILFSAVTDPVEAGLVESLDRPGPKITGMTDMSPVDRQIQLIKGLQPDMKRLGVLYNPREANSLSLVALTEKECERQGIQLVRKTAEGKDTVITALEDLIGQCDAVYVPTDNTVISVIESVARLCARHRLPLYAADVDSVQRGAIVSLAIDYRSMGRQTAAMAERIFQGTSPADMPVESLKDLQIHLNIMAAERMGIDLPVDLLQAADAIYNSFPP